VTLRSPKSFTNLKSCGHIFANSKKKLYLYFKTDTKKEVRYKENIHLNLNRKKIKKIKILVTYVRSIIQENNQSSKNYLKLKIEIISVVFFYYLAEKTIT